MAFTSADVVKLEAAIAAGIRRVTFADGRSTEYQNADHMLAALNAMRSDVAGQTIAGQRRRRTTILRIGSTR